MTFRNLLVNLGLAVGNAAAKWEPFGVAAHLLEAYGKQRDKLRLRGELEALLRAGFGDFRAQLADAMGDLRLQLAEGVRGQVEAYLSQFQASARQAARLLGDPSATTVPATIGVDDPQQLAAFLPQRPPRFTVGDAVPGLPSWILVEPLGAGGFGEVWKGRHEDDGTVTAFKFLIDPTARNRFTASEARVLKEIHQKAPTEGVVKLLLAEARQEPPWLQFEYIDGGDLSRLPETWKGLPDVDRVQRVRGVVQRLAATAGHFHALGVVHRDLKPSNVLLRADGSLVVADFGISKIIPPSTALPTPTNASLATIRAYTAAYASPQQKRFEPADRRDDVYALGVLWYQLLRGDLSLERPSGDGWKRVLTKLGVGEWEIALLNRCWDDEADERPTDGNDLHTRLAGVERPQARAIAPRSTPVESPRPRPEVREPRGLREVWRGAFAALFLAVLMLLGLGGKGFFRDPPPPLTATSRPLEPTTASPGQTPTPLKVVDDPPITVSKQPITAPKQVETRTPKGVDGLPIAAPRQVETRTPKAVNDPRATNLNPGDIYIMKMDNPKFEMRFRWVPPGSFQMGGTVNENEKPIHKVTITKGFWMGETEVTQAQWKAIATDNPDPSKFKGDTRPVESISWDEANQYGLALAKAVGKPIRLPTEAEWEYAGRAGTTTDYCSGDGEQALKEVGWYMKNGGAITHPVGQLTPNAWGLHDMHGNVWEWCQDYDGPYVLGEQTDPARLQKYPGEYRVMRGGSEDFPPQYCRTASRVGRGPGYRFYDVGCRVCFCMD